MKSIPFLHQVRKVIPIEYNRLQRQLVGMRTLGIYPDGRDRKKDISFQEAAQLIHVMALNPNPFNDDFLFKINEYTQLISEDGSLFISDFAEIIENGFYLPSKPSYAVQRISFSLDRPMVSIVFETDEIDLEELANEDGVHIHYSLSAKRKSYRVEKLYGSDTKPLGMERFTILKKSTLRDLSLILMADQMLISDQKK